MSKRDYNTKQTPSNTVCSNGARAAWGSDGKVHCFNSSSGNRGDNNYLSGGSHGGSGGDRNHGGRDNEYIPDNGHGKPMRERQSLESIERSNRYQEQKR